MTELVLRNRQRLQPIALPLLRQIAGVILTELIPTKRYEIGIYLVSADEITRINETYLSHPGSTDVISFHYPDDSVLRGEIFISTSDAVRQAELFNTTWEAEVVRYIVHGLLHLSGYDDLSPGDRRIMKRHENRIVKALSQRFDFQHVSRSSRGGNSPRRRAPRKPS